MNPANNNPNHNPGYRGLRQAITPLLVALFAVSAVTGVLMFFHLKSVTELHIWTSLALVVISGFHLARNWAAMLFQFRHWPVWAGLAVAAAFLAGFLLFAPENHGPGGPHGRPHGGMPLETAER